MPSSSQRRKAMKSEVTNTKYPANTPPRLTPGQARSVRKLTRQCCNNDNGNCLLLDDGDPCICPQAISYSLICRYFRRGVLPAYPKLEDEILRPKGSRRCTVCGSFFLAGSGRAKYCAECAVEVHRKQKAAHARKKRLGVDN